MDLRLLQKDDEELAVNLMWVVEVVIIFVIIVNTQINILKKVWSVSSVLQGLVLNNSRAFGIRKAKPCLLVLHFWGYQPKVGTCN